MGNRDWGREFESMFQQHRRAHGGQWGGAGGPRARSPAPPPWLAGLFGLAGEEPPRGPRARRGDVRVAILAVLADGPLNGYQVIQEISERTGGAWRPSPGSVYPTISQLEDEGLVEGDDDRGRRTLRLSASGREYLDQHADEVARVWAPFAEGSPRRQDDGDVDLDFASL